MSPDQERRLAELFYVRATGRCWSGRRFWTSLAGSDAYLRQKPDSLLAAPGKSSQDPERRLNTCPQKYRSA